MRFRSMLLGAAAAFAFASGPSTRALAQGADMSTGWSVQLTPYLWLPAVNGTLRYSLPAPASVAASRSAAQPT